MWPYLSNSHIDTIGPAAAAYGGCALAQVADMATQTLPLPQLQLPPAGQLQRPGSGPDGRDANTTLYGVNAAMASGRAANGGYLQAAKHPSV